MKNKRINTFDTESQYDNYIWSAAPEFPNVGYVRESGTVHYQKSSLNNYTIYGTTTNTADFTIQVFRTTINCIVEPQEDGTYIFHSEDGPISVFYTWNRTLIDAEKLSQYQLNKTIVSLKKLAFNTSYLQSTGYLFSGFTALTSVNLSGWDTSNVTYMRGMFSGCESLTSLDLSSFDTSNVTDMVSMFSGCESLTSLDLSSFDTSNVTNMNTMFNQCSSLTSLDLSGWDTSNVTNMNSVFNFCSNLKTVYVRGCSDDTKSKLLTAAKSYSSSFTLNGDVISRP